MKTCLRLVVAAVALAVVVPGGFAQASDFDKFYSKFTTAAMNKDTGTLQAMMSRSFDFMTSTNVSPQQVFTTLAADNGQQWANLQNSLQGDAPVAQDYGGKPARYLVCTPTQVIYNCYVIFQKDGAGKWRWKAMVMPQK